MLKLITTLTDNPTNIVRLNGKLGWTGVAADKRNRDLVFAGQDVQFLALHIVDTEITIEVNDWFIDTMNLTTPLLAKYEEHLEFYNSKHVENSLFGQFAVKYGDTTKRKQCQKIIASTDSSLDLPIIPQHLIDGVIQHGIDNIVIENCYYAGDVFTVQWAEKLTQ